MDQESAEDLGKASFWEGQADYLMQKKKGSLPEDRIEFRLHDRWRAGFSCYGVSILLS